MAFLNSQSLDQMSSGDASEGDATSLHTPLQQELNRLGNLLAEMDGLLRVAHEKQSALLRIANARTAQGDFREALPWVGRVKLLEPGNRLAQELERTIQLAIASSNMEIGDVTPANLR